MLSAAWWYQWKYQSIISGTVLVFCPPSTNNCPPYCTDLYLLLLFFISHLLTPPVLVQRYISFYISVYITRVYRCAYCIYLQNSWLENAFLPSHLPNFFHVHYTVRVALIMSRPSQSPFSLQTLNVSIYWTYNLIIQSIIKQFIE